MQLSKTQISAILTEVVSQEDGFNELIKMSFDAMMKAGRQAHLSTEQLVKGNEWLIYSGTDASGTLYVSLMRR